MRIKQLIRNAGEPHEFIWGSLMLAKMNFFHGSLQTWAFRFLQIPPQAKILDIGCGGGMTIKRLRRLATKAQIYGLDLSALSVRTAILTNLFSVLLGRCHIARGNAKELVFKDGYFDLITAFETIYYWQNIEGCFREIRRSLRLGGCFMLCNETYLNNGEFVEKRNFEGVLELNLYSNQALETLLQKAGFREVVIHTHQNGLWVVILAYV